MMPTGSAVERAMQCPASCVLSRANHSSEAAAYGTDQHEEIADGDMTRSVVRKVIEGAEDVRHEVAFAIDVDRRSIREIGERVGRNYGHLESGEVALTLDLLCRRDGVAWVGDWKSRSRVSAVRDNWQIRCGVIVAMAAFNVDTVVGFLGYLDDGELEQETFDAFDVARWWSDLSAMVRRIREAHALVTAGGVPDVNSGKWCDYCVALPYCPGHTRLALSLLGELDGVNAKIEALTVEQCGRAWELLKKYDVLADRVKESIRARAKRETVPLSNGRRLALVESSRRSIDTKKAAEMLGANTPYKTSKFTQVRETKLSPEEERTP